MDKSRGVIRYIGGSHKRGLTVEDFHSVGVTDQKEDVWWYRGNRWAVNREDLTDNAYNMAVRHDPDFILVGGDPEEGGRVETDRQPIAGSMTPMPPPPEPEAEAPAVGYPSGATPSPEEPPKEDDSE